MEENSQLVYETDESKKDFHSMKGQIQTNNETDESKENSLNMEEQLQINIEAYKSQNGFHNVENIHDYSKACVKIELKDSFSV